MLTIRQIKTTTNADGKVVPVLDDKGQEIELASVTIPREVEAAGPEFIEQYLADPVGTLARVRGEDVPVPTPAAPVAEGSPTIADNPEE